MKASNFWEIKKKISLLWPQDASLMQMPTVVGKAELRASEDQLAQYRYSYWKIPTVGQKRKEEKKNPQVVVVFADTCFCTAWKQLWPKASDFI